MIAPGGADEPVGSSPPPGGRPEFGEDWLVAVLDSLEEAVVALDATGHFIAANPSAERLLGFSVNDVRGRPFVDIGWDGVESVFEADPVTATLDDGTPRRNVLVRLTYEGDLRWLTVNTTVLPLMSGESRPGVVVSMNDVTGEVLAQEALREHAAELERVNERLRRADALKADFLAMSSHELRTPLASLLGFVGVLDGDWDALDDDARREHLRAIGRQARELHGLVDALLMASQLESGTIVVRPELVPVALLVRRSLVAAPDTQRVDVEVPLHLVARIDPDHGRRVLSCLIDNAATHGEPPVEVQAHEEGRMVEVRVRDRGPGVSPAFVPHLFDRFAQASTGTARRAGGVGLGLAIAHELAVLNGGTLAYEPNAPAGACFVLRVPAE